MPIGGIERVWASIRPHNTPSRRIAERLGMRIDRTDHEDRGRLNFDVIDLRKADA
ncbi:GNAT family N-acetyltransferase [Micromonospora sp. NBC_00898]|uniref:GNAT family N-acetyltransferase n=1 Tax=Micromonospora sp. NBC_00898 TaxID=2975981 RepID=UPI003864E2EC|nr:GNAT family N-acetyltransferase [Micromonospora sp. NBC_00898]